MSNIINKDRFEIRPYQTGDESEILKLFQTCFGREMSMEYWRWRFWNNPLKDVLIELAWDGDTLAGHYAASPVALMIDKKEHQTALSMTTMTHPDYRGLSLFPILAKSLYNRMKENNYHMVWGFPNKLSHRGFLRDLDWKDIYKIPIFAADIEKIKEPQEISENIVELHGFDDRFDSLFQMATQESSTSIMVKRNSKFLTWRFSEHPENSYYILGYIESGDLLGYAVYKKYRNALDIVDLLAVSDQNIGLKLVSAVISVARGKDIQHINMWLPLNRKLHRELERIGFTNEAPITYWGICPLNSLLKTADVLNYRNWYFTMADSDVY